MQEKIKLAGHVFMIESIYGTLNQFSQNYITNEAEEFFVKTTAEDIEAEKAEAFKEYAWEKLPLPEFPDGSYEFCAIYRKIAELLFAFDILVYHGSVVAVDNCAYMFIAVSGTGKSTHTRLWREMLGEKATMVNDDKPLIQITAEGVTAYGTPWSGKHNLNTNIAVPLKGICILNQGEENSIREISQGEAYPMLLQQTNLIPRKEELKKTMQLIDEMGKHVRFYTMNCNISEEAAEMSYSAMHGGEIQL